MHPSQAAKERAEERKHELAMAEKLGAGCAQQ